MPEQAFTHLAALFLALAFNYIVGFHDAASTIAPAIATRALTARAALMLAAVSNLAGSLISHKVAYTIASGVADPHFMDSQVVVCGLLSATIWNLFTWRFGLPSSSSHALISGLLGAAVAKASTMDGALTAPIHWSALFQIAMALFTSPVFGFLVGFAFFRIAARWAGSAGPVATSIQKSNRVYARLQVASAALSSMAHGANDAQKTMGVMALVLMHGGYSEGLQVPLWVTAACAITLSLGTLSGGWRIIRSVAKKITDIQPVHGFSADAATGAVLSAATSLGMPVSTTHVAISSIIGVGAAKTAGKMGRDMVTHLIYAWAATIPVTALISLLSYRLALRVGFDAFLVAVFCASALLFLLKAKK
ncbi:MAG: inorganic phosphate transporter [Nitrospinae bacterium]|nr:inorganic phosphate transporter [Nitrospinota bacterium]